MWRTDERPAVAHEQDVIGSWVVFDPTGRGLRSAMQVGRVIGTKWDDRDDGDAAGFARPLLYVIPNGEDEPYAVTQVEAVLRRSS